MPLQTIANIELSGCEDTVRLLQGKTPGCSFPIYLIDAPAMFTRHGHPYKDSHGENQLDNLRRFAMFSQTVAMVALNQASINWSPDVVHCNDWQTGLVPALLSQDWNRPATIFSCHRINTDGDFEASSVDSLKLPPNIKNSPHCRVDNKFSMIKAGIAYSDITVTGNEDFSNTFDSLMIAKEYSDNFHYLKERLKGIDPSVDYARWSSVNDTSISQSYDASTFDLKQHNKKFLQEQLKLPIKKDSLLITIFSDLIAENQNSPINEQPPLSVFKEILKQQNIQICLFPNTKNTNETTLKLVESFPEQVTVLNRINEKELHSLIAGSDVILFPKINNITRIFPDICLSYGTIPIMPSTLGINSHLVNATADNLMKNKANVYLYENNCLDEIKPVIDKMIRYYFRPGPWWKKLASNSMKETNSWINTAQKYLETYQYAIDNPAPNPDKN